ncbi:hypothetical protein PsAD13_03179 [Pseudovibrio sp. Ad13]|nr:hypothetical protein [Pseudovibrio sp. Ad13]KZK82977.1 hypothetical protein PsAD13_03179 [Pseudovibrio sp. Ad13]
MKYLAIIITPFIWHWPHIDRSLSADYVVRFGPFNITGPFRD